MLGWQQHHICRAEFRDDMFIPDLRKYVSVKKYVSWVSHSLQFFKVYHTWQKYETKYFSSQFNLQSFFILNVIPEVLCPFWSATNSCKLSLFFLLLWYALEKLNSSQVEKTEWWNAYEVNGIVLYYWWIYQHDICFVRKHWRPQFGVYLWINSTYAKLLVALDSLSILNWTCYTWKNLLVLSFYIYWINDWVSVIKLMSSLVKLK